MCQIRFENGLHHHGNIGYVYSWNVVVIDACFDVHCILFTWPWLTTLLSSVVWLEPDRYWLLRQCIPQHSTVSTWIRLDFGTCSLFVVVSRCVFWPRNLNCFSDQKFQSQSIETRKHVLGSFWVLFWFHEMYCSSLFSVFACTTTTVKTPTVCVFSRWQIVYMISNMILVLSKGIICLTSGVMCYVWLTYGYAKGEGVSNIAFPLVLSMMFGYFVVKLSLLNAVSILVNAVSTLFQHCFKYFLSMFCRS